jgi:CheY-like chemotaxis protein
MMMPIMDGSSLLKLLQADAALASIPVLLTTAVQKPALYGTRGLLRKPYNLGDLLQAAEQYCAPAAA